MREHSPFLDPERATAVRRALAEIGERSAGSILGKIGHTDLVELSTRVDGAGPLLAKLEGQNPSGSVKDRLALYLVADAVARGLAGPNTTLVEASSGNTGISLAMICARLGQKVLITVPDNVSVERHKLIRRYGAELVLTPGVEGTSGAILRAREIGSKPGYHWVAQHFNEVNSFAHYETTGAELVEQLGRRKEPPAAFIATSGTTGTLMGISARLREAFPRIRVVAVWPKDRIMGIRRPEGDLRPGIYQESRIDEVVEIANEEALEVARRLSSSEGLMAGPSGGAAIAAALKVAAKLGSRGSVVTLLPDWGERYLSLGA